MFHLNFYLGERNKSRFSGNLNNKISKIKYLTYYYSIPRSAHENDQEFLRYAY